MADNSQYMWRQRRKRKSLLTVWIVAVIIMAALGTFAYEGLKESNPLNVAKKYLEQEIGVSEYELSAGTRSLNNDNLFQQEVNVKYTADGKEEERKLILLQQEKKKFGIFEQWDFETQDKGNTMEVELIAPVISQVLVNGVAPTDSEIKVDTAVAAGTVCYDLTEVEIGATLQVNGLPFDSYEAVITEDDAKLDLTEKLVVGENAKTQMTEMAKSMLNELFDVLIQGEKEDALGDLFAQTPNKSNLYKVLKKNLYDGEELKIASMTFKEFKPVFGELKYPEKEGDNDLGMEMTLGFTCDYNQIEKQVVIKEKTTAVKDTESESETETETEAAETEAETEIKTSTKRMSVKKEAKFYFKYMDGECVVTSMEVPNVLS